jgi:hypothetical protein
VTVASNPIEKKARVFSLRGALPRVLGHLDTFRLAELLLGAMCLYLSWQAVSWAMQPGLSMILDEISNLHMFLGGWKANHYLLTTLPHFAYNDRPVGFTLERWGFELFGFHYRPQLALLLSIHFANLALGFLLCRRLGGSVLASLGGLCAFATLLTTAQTATFLGAIFDVLGLFFILTSVLAFLSRRRGTAVLSALLFFLALRTKEFAIVLPVLLLAIAYFEQTWSRLWIHLVIWIVFVLQYARLIRVMMATTPAGNPYVIRADFDTVMASLAYYTSLIFHVEGHPAKAHVILAIALAVVGYALYRRHRWILWALAAYLLTLLPLTILPGIRASFYVYAPALFLMLAISLTVEDMTRLFIPNARARWFSQAAAALLVVVCVFLFQRGPYFKNRVDYALFQRRSAAATAADLSALRPGLQPDSWLFVDQGPNPSWLLFPGPCDYLNLPLHRQSYSCVLGSSADGLRKSYDAQKAPKYYMVYSLDGSLRIAQ